MERRKNLRKDYILYSTGLGSARRFPRSFSSAAITRLFPSCSGGDLISSPFIELFS